MLNSEIDKLKAAFQAGKKIEVRVKGSNDQWIIALEPTWNTADFEWRLAQRLLPPVTKLSNSGYYSAVIPEHIRDKTTS